MILITYTAHNKIIFIFKWTEEESLKPLSRNKRYSSAVLIDYSKCVLTFVISFNYRLEVDAAASMSVTYCPGWDPLQPEHQESKLYSSKMIIALSCSNLPF